MYHKYILIILILLFPNCAPAAEIESLDQAIKISTESSKPILLEFVRDDCLYCELAESEAETIVAIKNALEKIVHYSVNIKSDEGVQFKDQFGIGNSYPVFILVNSEIEIYNRWVGYTTSDRFVSSLNNSLSIKKTINRREADFVSSPSLMEAVNLGRYFSECRQFKKSNDYYFTAGSMGKKQYNYQIFRNCALMCENNFIPYDSVLIAADRVINAENPNDIIYTVRILSNLARAQNETISLAKYLQRGIEISSKSSNTNFSKFLPIFKADLALYGKKDINAALHLRILSLGAGWESKPDKFFEFAEWCLERKINLNEAEKYARKASTIVKPGQFKGKVLIKLAMILHEQGRHREAYNTANAAMNEHPENEYYQKIFDDYRDILKNSSK